MLVETYEVEELLAATREPMDPGAEDLIQLLGLEGQRRFVGKAEDGETPKVIPYRLMTVEELRVYSVLFPEHTRLEKYGACAIPLRVLQVAAHAGALPDVKHLEVWHPRVGSVDPDPLLVGVTTDPVHSWRNAYLMLARWGTALESFEQLHARAASKLAAQWRADAAAVRQKADAFLSTAEVFIEAYLHGRGEAPSWTPEAAAF